MTTKPFTADDPLRIVEWDHSGIWLTATVSAAGDVTISDRGEVLHAYRIAKRRTTADIIDSLDATLRDLEWERGPITEWITGL